MKQQKAVHIAEVVYFSGHYGYTKIEGGEYDGQTVLIEASRCRITFSGFISNQPEYAMPSEGKRIALILDRKADPLELRAFVWGPAKSYLREKAVKPKKIVMQKTNGASHVNGNGNGHHKVVAEGLAEHDETRREARNKAKPQNGSVNSMINLSELITPRDMPVPPSTMSVHRGYENPNQRRPRRLTCGIAS